MAQGLERGLVCLAETLGAGARVGVFVDNGRTEASRLDLVDLRRNRKAPQFRISSATTDLNTLLIEAERGADLRSTAGQGFGQTLGQVLGFGGVGVGPCGGGEDVAHDELDDVRRS
jgi:hypothetical protein